MSVEINWDTLTGGPDGAGLAEQIREFIHERFQVIPLPNLIRSVTVHSFDFGTIAPQVTIKDITDPLQDFYDTDGDDDDDDQDDEDGDNVISDDKKINNQFSKNIPRKPDEPRWTAEPRPQRGDPGSRHPSEFGLLGRTLDSRLARGTTPGVLGTTSYFGLPLPTGFSGTQTPLAAVAGAQYQNNNGGGQTSFFPQHHHADSFSSISPPTSPMNPVSPPPQDSLYHDQRSGSVIEHPFGSGRGNHNNPALSLNNSQKTPEEVSPEDLQVVFHVTYSGDVKLSLTADVFLDYPMPSFVGIPLKLRITGLTFNGVGILAYIKSRAHVCFLSPEDAEALVGNESTTLDDDDPFVEPELKQKMQAASSSNDNDGGGGGNSSSHVGALLENIHIESEMGETESGKQVLKNVGKIEKFILEQVQRIFEDEFVYPSFWTFLV